MIFDLFNEPFPDNNHKTTAAWNCWKYGTHPIYCPLGTAGLNYHAAGMQDLVNAVREVGASNVIMVGGIQYAATLDQWKDYVPKDPLKELVASWHPYNNSFCSDFTCWFIEVLPVMKSYPVIAGEIGENDGEDLHDSEDEEGHAEGPAEPGEAAGNLVGYLFAVAVYGAAGEDRAVEESYFFTGEMQEL